MFQMSSILLFFYLLLGCNSDNNTTSIDLVDSSVVLIDSSMNKIENVSTKDSINPKIEGIWGQKNEENATFKIKKDSICYFSDDNLSCYKYTIKNDSIKIFYDGFEEKYQFKINPKTKELIFIKDKEITQFIRF